MRTHDVALVVGGEVLPDISDTALHRVQAPLSGSCAQVHPVDFELEADMASASIHRDHRLTLHWQQSWQQASPAETGGLQRSLMTAIAGMTR